MRDRPPFDWGNVALITAFAAVPAALLAISRGNRWDIWLMAVLWTVVFGLLAVMAQFPNGSRGQKYTGWAAGLLLLLALSLPAILEAP